MDKFVPVTTDLNLRLRTKPLYLPLDKDYSLTLMPLRSAFGSNSIGLIYIEQDIIKVVPCKGTKLYPPRKVVLVPFVVIRETDCYLGPQTTDNSDNSVRQTRYNQSKPANFQNQSGKIPSQSSSSSPDTQTFPEFSRGRRLRY